MSKYLRSLAVGSALVVVGAFPARVSAVEPTVPFMGHTVESVPFSVDPTAPLPISWQGTIVTTHLGLGTYTGAIPFPIPDPTRQGCEVLPTDGTARFVGADGDAIDMVISRESWSLCDGVADVTYSVLGGTGRFGGVTGNIELVDGQLNFVEGVPGPVSFDTSFDGTLTISPDQH